MARLEERVGAMASDITELKEELRAFRIALMRELKSQSRAREARLELCHAALQPKSLIPLAIIVVSLIAGASGMMFSWGDFEIGGPRESVRPLDP